MNKTHCLIWSEVRQTWIVAHEAAVARGKPASRRKRLTAALAGALLAQSALAQPPAPTALPTGGSLVAGQAAIAQSGSQMTVTQSTDKAIFNWQSFNIGSQAGVTFQQPSASSVILNRVLGGAPSAIYGSLNANGQVFLVNPGGVLFGQGARVDVGGLVASTLNIRNEDFLAGNHRFTRDGATAGVTNQGELLGKYVALLAPEVRNEGVIAANMGTAALAAGEAVTLGITGNALIDVQVEQASIDTLVENKHLVKADAGTVVLSAQSAHTLLGQVVNSGAIEAQGLVNEGGTVRLSASASIDHSGSITADAGANGNGGSVILMGDLANPNSQTTVSGSITAKGGSASGDGGFVETSGTHLKITDTARIDTSAAQGKAGTWLLDPDDFTIGTDITGATLGTLLNSNNVTIQTTGTTSTCATDAPASCGSGATGTGNGDIFVNDTVSWGSAFTLTLDAWRNIEVSQAISVTGTGGLTLKYGQQAANSGNTAAYLLSAPINLASGATFQTQLGNDVGVTSYTIVNNRAALDTVASGSDYVLGANFAAGGTAFTPISSFTNVFDGLGHKIDGLIIDTADFGNSGMFAEVGQFMVSGGEVRNLGLTNVSVTGTASWMGGIAGTNRGSIHHSYVTGSVGSAGGAGTMQALGGLVGSNNGTVVSSYSGATVTGASGDLDAVVGGLVGVNTGGSIANSYATGAVSKASGATTGAIGGLVGSNEADGSISNSYSRGSVSAGTSTRQGGLVGMNGNNDVGTDSTISNSYYSSTTSGQATGIGDDVAAMSQTVTAKTTAQLTAASVLADLGLSNIIWLRDSATGYPVLIGIVYGAGGGGGGGSPTVIYIRLIPGSSTYGDAVSLAYGLFDAATAGTSITDASPSGTVSWTGTVPTSTSNAGIYSLTYSGGITLGNAGYSLAAGDAASWTITQRPITVTPTSGQTKVYNGQGGADPALAYASIASQLVNGDSLTPTGALARAAGSNVGNYAINLGNLASNNANYSLALSATTVNFGITAKALSMSGLSVPASKVYSGTTAATVSGAPLLQADEAVGAGTSIDGMRYTGDTVSITGTPTGTYNSKDVSTASTVSFGGLSLTGTQAGNYTLTMQGDASATITQAPLTVTAQNASKVYGDANPALSVALTGFAGGETLATSGVTGIGSATTAATATTGVGTAAITVGVGTLVSGNYAFSTLVDGSLTITPKPLNVTVSKVYDGNASFSSGFTVSGTTVNGDATPTITSGSASVSSPRASGTPYSSFTSTPTLSDANYTLSGGTVSATITPKTLTASLSNTGVTKVYDATTNAPAGFTLAYTLSGFVSGDTDATLGHTGAAYNSKDVLSANTVTVSGLSITDVTGNKGSVASDYALNAASLGVVASITAKALDLLGLTVPQVDGPNATHPTVNGTPALRTALAPGAGTSSDGAPYAVDVNDADPLRIRGSAIGTPQPGTGNGATIDVQITGLSLDGAGKGNYTLTSTSVSAPIQASTLSFTIDPIHQTVAEALAAVKEGDPRHYSADYVNSAEKQRNDYLAGQKGLSRSAMNYAKSAIRAACPLCDFTDADYDAWLGIPQQTAQGGQNTGGGQQKTVPNTAATPKVEPIKAKLSGSVSYEEVSVKGNPARLDKAGLREINDRLGREVGWSFYNGVATTKVQQAVQFALYKAKEMSVNEVPVNATTFTGYDISTSPDLSDMRDEELNRYFERSDSFKNVPMSKVVAYLNTTSNKGGTRTFRLEGGMIVSTPKKEPHYHVSAATNLPAGTEVTVSFKDASGNTKTTTAKVGEDGGVKVDGAFADLKLPVTANITSKNPEFASEDITLGGTPPQGGGDQQQATPTAPVPAVVRPAPVEVSLTPGEPVNVRVDGDVTFDAEVMPEVAISGTGSDTSSAKPTVVATVNSDGELAFEVTAPEGTTEPFIVTVTATDSRGQMRTFDYLVSAKESGAQPTNAGNGTKPDSPPAGTGNGGSTGTGSATTPAGGGTTRTSSNPTPGNNVNATGSNTRQIGTDRIGGTAPGGGRLGVSTRQGPRIYAPRD